MYIKILLVFSHFFFTLWLFHSLSLAHLLSSPNFLCSSVILHLQQLSSANDLKPSSWPAAAVTLPFQVRCFFLACYDDESQSPSSSSPLSGKQKVMRHLRHFHLHHQHQLHEGKKGKHCPSLRSHLDVFLSALNRGVHSQLSQPAALSNGYVCIHPRTPLHIHRDPSS